MACWGESPDVLEGYGWTYHGDGEPLPGSNWTRVEHGNAVTDTDADQSVCALDDNGLVTCWGALFSGCDESAACWPSVAFADLAVGLTTACGLTADGDVHCWGGPLGAGQILATDAVAVECDFISAGILHGDESHSRYFVEEFDHGWHTERLAFASHALSARLVDGASDCVFVEDGRVLCGPFPPETESGPEGLRASVVWMAPSPPAWVGAQSSSGGFCSLSDSGALHCDIAPSEQPSVPGDIAGQFSVASVHPGTAMSGCGLSETGELSCWGDMVKTPSAGTLRWTD